MSNRPAQIGRYRISRTVGTGAMGAVYEAFDPVIERRVAIKTVIKKNLDEAELEEALARFKREAQAGGRLNHPGIVAVHEFGEGEAEAFIVMEYVDGKELRQHFRTGSRFDLVDVLELMQQLLAALDYCHRQGVVHLDIKPANLMVLPGPRLKVMDFGIARIGAGEPSPFGAVAGTPTHMAPERIGGQPADGRADLWSSGVILYELITGQNPFLAETPSGVMHKVLQVSPDAPSCLHPSLPPAVDAVVARALAKNPGERFQTAREFHGALLSAFQDMALMAPRGMTEAELALDEMPDPPRTDDGNPAGPDKGTPQSD
jgi:eukaryotic-like serine/threonine-protein kinase